MVLPWSVMDSNEKFKIVSTHRHRREFKLVEVISTFSALWSVKTLNLRPIGVVVIQQERGTPIHWRSIFPLWGMSANCNRPQGLPIQSGTVI